MEDLKALHGNRIEVHLDDRGRTLDVADLVSSVADDTELYMCGPIRLMDAVRRAWSDNGLDPTIFEVRDVREQWMVRGRAFRSPYSPIELQDHREFG